MSITMREIAKIANVSKSTVSKVLNDSSEISSKTKKRVRKIMDQYGYIPNSNAQNLAKNKTGTIALIIPHSPHYVFSNPFLTEVLVGISEVLSANDYSLLFIWEKEFEYSILFENKKVDGVLLLMVHYDNPYIQNLVYSGCPLVCIGEHSLKENIRYVDSYDEQGVYQVVEFLAGQNHHRIGFLGGNRSFCSGINRLKGYYRAVLDIGLDKDDALVLLSNDENLQRQGQEIMKRLLGLKNRPTAIVCFNDLIAIGAIHAINQEGLRVPDDISVVGFDNIPLCEYIVPRLTTVNNVSYEKGKTAAKWLLDVIELGIDNAAKNPILLPVDLIIRDSTIKIY